jgi:hypothetical protein
VDTLERQQAIEQFFADFYAPAPFGKGVIEIRRISHDGEPVKRALRGSPTDLGKLVGTFALGKAGVYFGVALRKANLERPSGKKADCAVVTALWVDIDVRKEGWDMKRVLGALKMSRLRPSLIVNSGNGYHCYWLLRDPVVLVDVDAETAMARLEMVEKANAHLAELFGGDPACVDITRVLRVPYTENKKGDKPLSITVESDDWSLEYTIEEILSFEERERLFDGEWIGVEALKAKAREKRKVEAPRNKLSIQLTREMGLKDRALGFSEIWNHTRYGGSGGMAYMGVDEAILRSTALLYSRYGGEWSDKQIVDYVLHQVQKTKQRDAPKERWDWDAERKEIEEKLERFKPRWAELKGQADGEKRRGRGASGRKAKRHGQRSEVGAEGRGTEETIASSAVGRSDGTT